MTDKTIANAFPEGQRPAVSELLKKLKAQQQEIDQLKSRVDDLERRKGSILGGGPSRIG